MLKVSEGDFVELVLKPEALERYGLPVMAYPLLSQAFLEAIGGDGELPLPDMLFGLQNKSARDCPDWQSLEPAMARLAELIAPDDGRDIISAASDEWWLEIGPVALDGPVIAIQRKDELVAALACREDGRLRAAAFRPLDARIIGTLMSLSQNPHPVHGVYMRENNWEYARDASAGTGQFYAYERGEAYLNYWPKGLGDRDDGQIHEAWIAMRTMSPRQPSQVAVEIGVCYSLSAG